LLKFKRVFCCSPGSENKAEGGNTLASRSLGLLASDYCGKVLLFADFVVFGRRCGGYNGAICLTGFTMQLSEFDYHLPEHLIAQHPPEQRGGSRLMHVDGMRIADTVFTHFLEYVQPGDVLVFNDTRVLKARLFGEKASGGKIEALVERVLDEHSVLAHVRASKSPKPGGRLLFAERWEAEMVERVGELFKLRFLAQDSVYDILEASGKLPLPPYIERDTDADDDSRYQTVYAREQGAVAAPTAGLHFTDEMLEALKARGAVLAWVTLHVGAGTFQPVRVDDIREHKMHSEVYEIPQTTVEAIAAARQHHKRVMAVGTTSLRALESAARGGELVAGRGETDIFITPGYRFNVVDRLLTNFHLPKSTLLMLVSAFAGLEEIRAAYLHAVNKEYRFFSYGDAMLLERKQ
jgi:S-adenosylmethionine:tRNA ribosyltransferase-isomerase